MRQSSIIFGALFVAFIVFITVRGELPNYIGVLFPKSGGSSGASSGDLLGSAGSMFGGLGSIFGSGGSSSGALGVGSLNPGGFGG